MSVFFPLAQDFTEKDHAAVLLRLRQLAQTVFPDFAADETRDVDEMLLELFAHIVDKVLFYQDNQAREARWSTARLLSSILSMAGLVGYRASSAAPASVDVVFTLAAPAAADVPIPNGFIVRTLDASAPVLFQLVSGTPNITIPAGQTSVVGTVEHSTSVREVFASTGLVNQDFQLGQVDYLDGKTTVTAGNGVYTEVADLLRSGPNDRHYTVRLDRFGRGRVRFGNGVLGAVPTGDVTIDYRTGGGVAGNVPENTIRRADAPAFDVHGAQVSIAVSNPTASSGGRARPTKEQLRDAIPAFVRATTRSVCDGDHEAHVLELPQVARVLVLTADDDPTVPENSATVLVVPAGGGYPSSELKALVLQQLTVVYPPTTTFRVYVGDPDYRTVDVDAVVFFSPGRRTSAVAAIRTALTAFFAPLDAKGVANGRVDFGGNTSGVLAWSDVFNVIRDTPGVLRVDPGAFGLLLAGERKDLVLLAREFPQLGNVRITDGATGEVLG